MPAATATGEESWHTHQWGPLRGKIWQSTRQAPKGSPPGKDLTA